MYQDWGLKKNPADYYPIKRGWDEDLDRFRNNGTDRQRPTGGQSADEEFRTRDPEEIKILGLS